MEPTIKFEHQPSEDSVEAVVLSPPKQGKVDLTKMVAAKLKIPGNKKVGVKQLLANEPGVDRIENLRQENRERSKKERLELAYPLIQKDEEEEGESDEDSVDDEDYSIENTDDSLGSSEEDSSDDYTSDESFKNDDDGEEHLEDGDLEVSHDSSAEKKGKRRSKRINSQLV